MFMLKNFVDEILPIIIGILETMGIFIITLGAFRAFYHYMKTLIFKDHYPVKHQFANSMATGLEFKLAAEILKTVLIQSLSELLILGSILFTSCCNDYRHRMGNERRCEQKISIPGEHKSSQLREHFYYVCLLHVKTL